MQLEKLATPHWNDGVSGLLLLLNHPLIVSKPLEFAELKKSIYYNLGLKYREVNDNKKALYFYFNFYKLNPENVSIIVEIAILFRKELVLEQSAYFFKLALAKESSPAMKLYYMEQIAVITFVIGNHAEALDTCEQLLKVEFKRSEIQELRYMILAEMNQESRSVFDFFSPEFEFLPASSSNKSGNDYQTKIQALRSEYSAKKLQIYKEETNQTESSNNPGLEEDISVKIDLPKPRWKELLNALLTILKVNKLRAAKCSLDEISAKMDKSSSHKYLSKLDFDLLETQFRVKAPEDLIKEPLERHSIEDLLPKVEEIKVVPREERYGGGQMALREKKSSSKVIENSQNEEADFSKGLEHCLHGMLRTTLEAEEFNFVQSELADLTVGQNFSLKGDQLEV